ncbi:LamG domain-containing protein [Streptomyces sp. MUM 203J]|uniref:CBM96 family carbohydrate-binding protein n=1 Tax=Streptomyces sp. MUM 203J TaxID=2791990 RepID=UPI001F043D08|nr:LamG-like jellyroll fold domain-containing protein [Streptomyces sp. MUM 203J]MCH0538413.1 LamG domain-containing protein [Streptomyces sp. MUM 203J]
MNRSRGLRAALALSVAVTGLSVAVAPQAGALTAPVAFTADDLPTWQTNGIVWALAQADGVVFAGGTFSAVRPPEGSSGSAREALNFVALDAATGAPTDCELSFTVPSGSATVRALAVSPDKKTLYAAGYFGAVNGQPVSSAAAIDIASCTPKTGFNAVFPATVRALAVTNDTVYAGGDFSEVNGQTRKRFAAVDAVSGELKPFTADADEPGRAVEVTPDGQNVLLGGDFFEVNGQDSHALAVVNAQSGSVVKAYPTGYIPWNSVVKDIDTDATGFYTGNEGTGGGVFDGRIALDLNGFSERWRDTCLGATQAVESHKNVLYSASHAHDCSSVGEFPDGRRYHFLAQPTTSTGKLGWFPDTNDGLGEGIGPRAITVAAKDGVEYLWSGGEFTTVNGAAGQGLTRFASTGDTGKPTTPDVSAASVEPGEVQVRWRTSLDLDDSKLTYKVYRDGGATPIATLDAESLPWHRPQASFTDKDLTSGATHSYRVTATDAAGNVSALSATASATVATTPDPYASQVIADGASMYWRLDDTTSPYVADSSTGDLSGLQTNGPTQGEPGAVATGNKSFGFDGVNDRLYSDRRVMPTDAYSIETWFKTTTWRGGKLIGFGNNTTRNSSKYDKHLYMTNWGQLVFGAYNRGVRTIVTPSSYNDGKWHHVVGTQGPGGMTLYVDGKKIGTHSNTGHEKYLGYWHVGADSIGGGWPYRPSSYEFAGLIDEAAVYPTALSAAQVATHHAKASVKGDTVTTVEVAEDTYVNAGAQSTNYGGSTSLAVRGTSRYETYLRFQLPAAPAGTKLVGAALEVKTNSASYAGSVDPVQVRPVTGTWTESGVTYATRPTLGDETLGTLTSPNTTNTAASVQLDAAALSAGLGGTYDMALTGEGTDSLWLWSSEASQSGGTPKLILTFSPN